MAGKHMVTMRPKEVHTAHFIDYLGHSVPTELHMNAFSSDGIEYEIGALGTFEAHEAQVELLEAHGFERVPDKINDKPPPKFVLGPDGKFMSRAAAAAAEADLLQQAAKKAAEKSAAENPRR